MKQKINWKKYFSRNDKKNTSPLDLNQLFPGYFNKNVFRVFVGFMILLFVFTMQSNDWRFKYNFVMCPADSPGPCLLQENFVYNNVSGMFEQESDYLQPGESRGVMPNEHGLKFNDRVMVLVWLSFLFNHLAYMMKHKDWRIPINKAKFREIKKAIEEASK